MEDILDYKGTMKISELITVLQQKLQEHGDLKVFATWEGVLAPIWERHMAIERTKEPYSIKPAALIIDVENYNDY